MSMRTPVWWISRISMAMGGPSFVHGRMFGDMTRVRGRACSRNFLERWCHAEIPDPGILYCRGFEGSAKGQVVGPQGRRRQGGGGAGRQAGGLLLCARRA